MVGQPKLQRGLTEKMGVLGLTKLVHGQTVNGV